MNPSVCRHLRICTRLDHTVPVLLREYISSYFLNLRALSFSLKAFLKSLQTSELDFSLLLLYTTNSISDNLTNHIQSFVLNKVPFFVVMFLFRLSEITLRILPTVSITLTH